MLAYRVGGFHYFLFFYFLVENCQTKCSRCEPPSPGGALTLVRHGRHLSAILVDAAAASCFSLCLLVFFSLLILFKCSDRLVVLVARNDNMRLLFVAAGCSCCSCSWFVVLNGDFIKYAAWLLFVVALKLCCFPSRSTSRSV